jgi:hypothetical protein
MDWFTGLIGKISGKPTHYVLLIFGTIFALVAFAQIPLENADNLKSETVWESIILGLISLILIGTSLYLIIKDNRMTGKILNKEKEIEDLNKGILLKDEEITGLKRDLLDKNEEIYVLKQGIERAINFIGENRNDSNRLFLDKVSKIFEEISSEFSQHSSNFGDRIDSIEWINQRIDKWCNEVDLERYSEYGVSSENGDVFRNELKKHLKLICKNIQESKNSAPLLAQPPVPQTVGSYKLYEKAIRDIEEKALTELADEESLSMQSIQILKTSLSNFIQLIKYSS